MNKHQRYYQKNKEKILAYQNKYNNENKDKIKQYYIDNSDKIKQYSKKYYKDNKEHYKKYNKKYWKENGKNNDILLSHRISSNKRRVKILESDDYTIHQKSISELLYLQFNECKYCLCNISKSFHIDHIIPISKGGLHTIHNIQLLCETCNLSKGNKIL